MHQQPTHDQQRHHLQAIDALVEAADAWGRHQANIARSSRTGQPCPTIGQGLSLRASLLRASEAYHNTKAANSW